MVKSCMRRWTTSAAKSLDDFRLDQVGLLLDDFRHLQAPFSSNEVRTFASSALISSLLYISTIS
jgi:hypothetical protein